jgi:hypothetical protein
MAAVVDPRIRELRKKLLKDFRFYAKHVLKIRTKDGQIKKFVLNVAQEELLRVIVQQMETEGKVRIIILKGRQMGLSTVVGGFLYWWVSQHKAQKAMVVTHHGDSTKTLFDMTKRYFENTPDMLRPHTKYSSRKELMFDILDSSYTVATAGGESIGRGETITQAHISELAFWQASSAKDNLNGLLQCIPNTPGTAVFIESTANGVSGPYYEMWKGAVEGTNGYVPVFLPWFIDAQYREPVPDNFKRTPDEEDLAKKYGLDNEQLMFRRRKVAASGLELFQQEYPCNADEAFLTSGRPVFNSMQLQEAMENTRDMEQRLALEGEEFVEHSRGELLVFRPHVPGETYYIGADVAMGVKGGDYSVAQVFDSKKRQVAVYRAHVHPDHYAQVLYALGMHYNTAFLIVENNNHGILTCTRLGKDMAYPNFYMETQVDKLTEKETIKLGFTTNAKTKPLIIDQLRASMRMEEIELNDKVTIREMLTYIVNENGGIEAEQGCHDDCVVSLALVNHIHEGSFTPVETPQEMYLEPI